MSKLVTIKQAAALREIGYTEPTFRYAYKFDDKFRLQDQIAIVKIRKTIKLVLPVPTVDEVVDWLRKKHHIMIYNCIEPFVDPVDGRIKYGYKVKKCNKKWGWNYREYVGDKVISHNCYAAKRACIWTAIRYIKKQKENAERRRSCKNR